MPSFARGVALLALVPLVPLTLGACGASEEGEEGDEGGEVTVAAEVAARCGFTPDFAAFLERAPYASHGFGRADLTGCSSYGGRAAGAKALVREPVVFVHGNSDRGMGGEMGGWGESVAAFQREGYRSHELYAFTWGDGAPMEAALQYHSRAHLQRVRAFLEAVLAYTGAAKIDVIGHSMGVTLARKAILGGPAADALAGGDYDLGPSLGARVDTFVGIAGGNLGLTSCWFTGPTSPTCGASNGFYPGTRTLFGNVAGRSRFLDDLLARPHGEAAHVFSMWSSADALAGRGAALVWGAVTARLPEQDGEIELDSSYDHLTAKSRTGAQQVRLVTQHTP